MSPFPRVHVAAITGLCLILTIMMGIGLHAVQAFEIPPSESIAFIQTNGAYAPLASGDYYTHIRTGNGPHIANINVPCTWRNTADGSVPAVTVALYDPESFEFAPDDPDADPRERLDPPAWDQVKGEPDNTIFTLKDPNGVVLAGETFTDASSDGMWVELATFVPAVDSPLCEDEDTVSLTYTLEIITVDNDENSWRLRIKHDPDCEDGACSGGSEDASDRLSNGDETDDFDGVPGTGDELSVGLLEVAYEHADTEMQTFYFFVELGEDPFVTLHNFDMDNDGTITYFSPSGESYDGTVSGFTLWNNPPDLPEDYDGPPVRGGDTIAIGPEDVGWWRAEIFTGQNNQYIFEGEINEPVRLQEPPAPQMDVSKDDGQTVTQPGDVLTYTIAFTNTSPSAAATNVILTDTLPENATYQRCTFVAGATGTCGLNPANPDEVIFDLEGVVAASTSGTAQVTVQVDPDAVGQVVNVVQLDYVSILGNRYSPVIDEDVNTIVPAPAPPVLTAAKTVAAPDSAAPGDCTVLVGELLFYDVVITNDDATAALDVTYSDTLDPHVQLVTDTLTISQGSISADTIDGNTVISATIDRIDAGARVTISYQARVVDELPDGPTDIVNQGTVFWNTDQRIETDDPAATGASDPTITRACPALTAIELERFTATQQGDTVRVCWVTTAEFDTWGFHLLRSVDQRRATAQHVTTELIPAKGRGQGGASYCWTDQTVEPGVRYTYWLEETELSGNTIEYGPATSTGAQDLHRQIYLPWVKR